MKRLLLATLAASVVLVAAALSGGQKPPTTTSDLQVQVEERNPWTHLRLNNAAETFHFVVVSDRTGGHRARIFSQAVEQINLLQPAFVISVGDLIEGYTKDEKRLSDEWREFQSYVCKLHMPFFYVAGNHDVSNAFMEKQWSDRFGRRYYHFVYRDVLFLILCSDDPATAEGGNIGKDQIAYLQKTLKDNERVRWTVVAVHKPLWDQPNVSRNGWLEVERALEGRPYTVFAGHVHRYQKFVRGGMSYYQLATTGGSSKLRGFKYGEFDHLVWVTMKKDGPVLANLMLDGIYAENMRQAVSDEPGHIYTNRKPVHPVKGKVHFEGTPTPEARVIFYLMDKQKLTRGPDAVVDADGSFVLSSYQAYDGAPAGEYAVAVIWRDPWLNERGRPGPDRLPLKYARPETSGLRVQITTGPNDVTLNLTR